jgi:hypothetical protein
VGWLAVEAAHGTWMGLRVRLQSAAATRHVGEAAGGSARGGHASRGPRGWLKGGAEGYGRRGRSMPRGSDCGWAGQGGCNPTPQHPSIHQGGESAAAELKRHTSVGWGLLHPVVLRTGSCTTGTGTISQTQQGQSLYSATASQSAASALLHCCPTVTTVLYCYCAVATSTTSTVPGGWNEMRTGANGCGMEYDGGGG